MPRELGTVEGSETLIRELYIDLRKQIHEWAAITKQTAQARMGYIGQHLVSVVTGYQGGRSGARGHDLVIPGHGFAEIKTCYRVDQLGKCLTCGAAVASIEQECSVCQSREIKRNDDSKWLITMKHEKDLEDILNPYRYYLVLFDFEDLEDPEVIRASIWEIDPLCPGFAFAMIDYWYNIRSKATSKAPFNLWPFSLKFDLMRPLLIYRSLITLDGVQTLIFPGRDASVQHPLQSFESYSQTNLTTDGLAQLILKLEFATPAGTSRRALLKKLDVHIAEQNISSDKLIDALTHALYDDALRPLWAGLPAPLKSRLASVNLG